MSRAAVATEIDRLDALGRTRALTDVESASLARLITVERRYKSANPHQGERRSTRLAVPIDRRLEVALAKMVDAGRLVRRVYLIPEDLLEAERNGILCDVRDGDARFRSIEVRVSSGTSSTIYDSHGCALTIRKYLEPAR